MIFKLEKFKEYDDYLASQDGVDKSLKARDMRLSKYRIAENFESGKQWKGDGLLRKFSITYSEIRKLQKTGNHNNIKRVFGDCDYIEVESADNAFMKKNEMQTP